MKRPIKFRAWDKKNKKMRMLGYDTSYAKIHGDGSGSLYESDETRIGYLDTQIILMQYTGLKDKNGKEIYEGDWIEGVYRDGKVHFQNGGFYCWDERLDESLHEDECEIIGNIYENKELLK